MDALDNSYLSYNSYPQNHLHHDIASRKLNQYAKALNDNAGRLFSSKPCLGFWDLRQSDKDFSSARLRETRSLEEVRCQCLLNKAEDTKLYERIYCRFIFLHSENSRSKLYTTKEMLMFALTYHQVVPWFIDFLIPFGQQSEPLDPRLSAFRHKDYSSSQLAPVIPQMSRSGNEFHICYNLRSVETTTSNPLMPYSIRQAAIYHSFDLKNGQSFWIVVKGNASLSEDIRKESRKMKWRDNGDEKTRTCSFESSLKTHLLVCNWACENWRSYSNYLERVMHDLTKDAVNREVIPRSMPAHIRESAHIQNLAKRTTTGFGTIVRAVSGFQSKHSENSNTVTGRTRSWKSPEAAEKSIQGLDVVPESDTRDPNDQRPYYRVKLPNLQQTQKNEEKVNDALFALQSNVNIMKSLKGYYTNLADLSAPMQKHVSWFAAQLDTAIDELQTYQATFDTILKLYAQRKQLLFGILEFQNMEASEELARKAQLSANRMETMTQKMEDLTRKTKKETTSMGVIAGVTMFFLPGTFVSTLMSTDIVKWNKQQNGTYQLDAAPGARNLFLALTLPLMLATFVTWLCIKWFYNTRDDEDDT